MSQYNLFLQIDHGKGGTSFHSVIPPLERVWPHPLTPFLKVFVNTEGCKLLQAKQVPQPFLIRRETLQSPHHLCSPALDSLQYFHVFVELGRPEVNKALEMWPHHAIVEGEDQRPGPLATLLPVHPGSLVVCSHFLLRVVLHLSIFHLLPM